MKENLLGYSIDTNSVTRCADVLMGRLASGVVSRPSTCAWLACLNPHSYTVALDDRGFAAALHDADWLIPDGMGVVWASRLLGGQVRERVTGSDIFFGLHQRMNVQGGLSVFFLGASEETLAQIRTRM